MIQTCTSNLDGCGLNVPLYQCIKKWRAIVRHTRIALNRDKREIDKKYSDTNVAKNMSIY